MVFGCCTGLFGGCVCCLVWLFTVMIRCGWLCWFGVIRFGLGLLGCVLAVSGLVGYYLFWVLVGGWCECCLLVL